MAEYDNTNSGMLATNPRKANAKHPDYSGQINVGGVDYWLSAWLKDVKPGSKIPGKKYFSLSVKPKEQSGAGGAAQKPGSSPKPANTEADDDQDVPF